MSGYVRLYRSMFGHAKFRDDAESLAFAWMVAKASWKSTRVHYKDRSINLDRGQFAVSVRDMATALRWTPPAIQRFLKKLKNDTMIETRADTGVTIITILNYDKFQGSMNEPDTGDDTGAETRPIQGRYTEQRTEELKKKKDTSRDKSLSVTRVKNSKHALPNDWEPSEFGGSTQCWKIMDAWPPGEIDFQLEHFRAHHRKKGDVFSSWQDAWKTWVLNSRNFGARNGQRQQPLDATRSALTDLLNGASAAAELEAESFGSDDENHRGDWLALPTRGHS